jgi:hypothetical protein
MNPIESLARARWLRCRAAFLVLTATVLALVNSGRAQSNADGYIYGRVAPPPTEAALVATNLGTGLQREVRPDAAGNFRFSALPVGSYTVTLRQTGRPDQTLEQVIVNVGTGSFVRFVPGSGAEAGKVVLEKLTVQGSPISPIDPSSTESATVFRAETIAQLPVERNLSAVAQLAPGTVRGATVFGNLISFGGASVAENAYFVNGFNITSFRDGLGFATVPFEFYDNFQVKTGGYSAEFGRSTGGVQNNTTRRGGNAWESGVSAYWSPAQGGRDNWSLDGNVHVGGPLVKNKLFVYGLYNEQRSYADNQTSASYSRTTNRNPFWGGKLDWNLSDRHSLEFTAFSDKAKTAIESFNYDAPTRTILGSRGVNDQLRGGKAYIVRYTGVFSDAFTLSVLAGQGDRRNTDRGAGDAYPFIIDSRSGFALLGRATTSLIGTNIDRRRAYRLDGEYLLGAHRFRFGLDREDNNVYNLRQYSGGVFWRYFVTSKANQALPNGTVIPTAGTQYAQKGFQSNGGNFRTINDAVYAEDSWRLMDGRLLLNLGLRSEGFDNRNVNGQTFVKIKNQVGPRVGAVFDPNKDGRSKFFANYGRYYLPLAAFTNAVLAGNFLLYQEYYGLNGLTSDSLPILGPQLGSRVVFIDGTVKDPRTIVDHNLRPMYQDEFILGYQHALGGRWTAGVRGIYRNLLVSQEDEYIDETLNDYAKAQGISGFHAAGNDYGVLTNPGRPMTITVDFGDGKGPRDVSFTPAQLKYPRAQRYYLAAEFFFERVFDGKWFLQGSYTLSHSYGNSEGWVRSDDGSGSVLSTAFDHVGLMDGARGDLPNDHRHKFKLFGTYAFARDFQTGASLYAASGTPISPFGYHPTDAFANTYGAASHYVGGILQPRGSGGRTPWNVSLALNLRYQPKWAGPRTTFGVDVYNALNLRHVTEVSQTAEKAAGVPDPNYGTPSSRQPVRTYRLSAEVKF